MALRICSKHPKYKAIREPKSCVECRVIWLEKEMKFLRLEYLNHYHYSQEYGGISKPIQ